MNQKCFWGSDRGKAVAFPLLLPYCCICPAGAGLQVCGMAGPERDAADRRGRSPPGVACLKTMPFLAV